MLYLHGPWYKRHSFNGFIKSKTVEIIQCYKHNSIEYNSQTALVRNPFTLPGSLFFPVVFQSKYTISIFLKTIYVAPMKHKSEAKQNENNDAHYNESIFIVESVKEVCIHNAYTANAFNSQCKWMLSKWMNSNEVQVET